MAITGKTSSAATLYYGPSTTTYVAQTTLSANTSLTLLWREGQFYYVECASPNRRGYISVSLVTNIAGGTPSTYTATYLTRYVYGEGSAMLGPGTSYATAGSLIYRQSVQFLSGKTSGGYALVEFTETGATKKKRGWFLQTKLTSTLPTPQIYTDGHVFNSDGEKWRITNAWASNTVNLGHLGIDIQRYNASGTVISTAKEVYAIAAGTVVASSDNTGGGNGKCIIIQHTSPGGRVYYSVYCHLSSRYVNSNTTVSEGQAIGVMGNTGNSSILHLHLSIIKNNVGIGMYGYNRDQNFNYASFSSSNYWDTSFLYNASGQNISGMNTRYFNPTAYFSQGTSFIDNYY